MHADNPTAAPALTEKQEACLARAPNRIVSAGAGSGKTTVLVERIGRLFVEGGQQARPLNTENLLALTFTRKAAGKMRTRVYEDLVQRLSRQTGPGEIGHLQQIIERFQTVKITTIHGFASSLIRANPVAVGVDPDFQLVEEAVSARAVREAVNTTLRDYWQKQQPTLVEILRLWEPYQVRKQIEELLHKPIEFRELCVCHGSTGPLDLITATREAKWAELRLHALDDPGWMAQLDTIKDHCHGVLQEKGNSQALRKKRDKAQRLIEEFVGPLHQALQARSPEEFDTGRLADLRRKVKEIGVFQWDAPTGVQLVDQIMEVAAPWFGDMDRERKALEWIGALLGLAQDAFTHLEKTKKERARLFHDDLLILAQDLCERDPRKAKGAMTHFLVDEFQDTDPIQWEMIRKLSMKDGHGPRDLFLVGDVKQAIYGFRGADHTVFKSAREVLARVSPDPEIVLDDNFRSLTGPLHFTNELFSRIFVQQEGESDPYAVPEQPLVPKRQSEAPSSVVFLVGDPQDNDPWAVEANAVVNRLSADFSKEDPRLGCLGEMAAKGETAVGILFRSYAPMTHYMNALTHAGLPFSVYQGRTFFDTPEVGAMLGLLAWMADPADDVALASVLRSPICAWTDEDLAAVALSCQASQRPLHEVLGSGEEAGRKASPTAGVLPSGASIQKTWWQLQRLRRLSSHLGLSETLRTALDTSVATILLSSGRRGLQASANIEKFLQTVRGLEESHSASPQVVLQAVRDMQEEGPGMAEAETPESLKSPIQLMTIHASKGLEFPVVVVACSGRGSGSGITPFSKRMALSDGHDTASVRRLTLCGIDFPDPSANNEASPTVLKAILKEHHSRQSESEEKRLLYVALTRARDHLILPLSMSDGKLKAAKGSLARFMLNGAPEIEQAVMDGVESVPFGEGTFKISLGDETVGRAFRNGEAGWEACPTTEQLEEISTRALPQTVNAALTAELPYLRRTRITVTELMTFRKCPKLFYFERYFRAPAGRDFQPGMGREEEADWTASPTGDRDWSETGPASSGESAGSVIGTMFHEVLSLHEEALVSWKHGAECPERLVEAVDRLATAAAEGPLLEQSHIRAVLLNHLGNLVRSGILRAGGVVLREVPFELEVRDFLIAGAIDRLEKLPDNTWRLWDFKTTSLAGRTKEAIVTEESYDLQLFCYVLAASRVLREPISSAAVVFTADPENPLFNVGHDPETIIPVVREVLAEVSLALEHGFSGFGATGGSCSACKYREYGLCRQEEG